jgi:hypothetical protein
LEEENSNGSKDFKESGVDSTKSTKQVTINLNDNTEIYTHSRGNDIGARNTATLLFGSTGTDQIELTPLYFKRSKNGTVDKEFFSYPFSPTGVRWDTFNTVDAKTTSDAVLQLFYQTTQNQTLVMDGGYNVYAKPYPDQTVRFVPVGSYGEDNYLLDDYILLDTVLPSELGVTPFNYIEAPNLPIFNTSDRAYWKASIEADANYVGGTAGKERWFHHSWINFTWLNTHIEDAYKYMIAVRNQLVKTKIHLPVRTKILDIVAEDKAYSYAKRNGDLTKTNSLTPRVFSFKYTGFSNTTKSLLAQRDDKQVIRDSAKVVKMTIDGGVTWSAGYDFAATMGVDLPYHGWIMDSGRVVIFGRGTKVFYSDDNCTTFTSCTILDKNGDPYVFHIPANANYPGAYFDIMNGFEEHDGVMVLGNYTNSSFGASPVMLWYSIDGITWKELYTFGQNVSWTDDGTASGGAGGTLLGDAANPIITRHIHGVNIGSDGCFYTAQGDASNEIRMMKCAYNKITDIWTVTPLLSGVV